MPIDATPWSGDHHDIKDGIGATGPERVYIDTEGNVWLEHSDGTFANYGPASSFTGSGKPKGRRGKDRARRRKTRDD
jgi:hypothetical protein